MCLLIVILGGLPQITRGADNLDAAIYRDYATPGWTLYTTGAADGSSQTYVHSYQKAIRVDLTAAQHFTFFRERFDTAGFRSFEFWIHGGTTGGQALTVAPLVNYVPQSPVSLAAYLPQGRVPAGVWTRVSIPLADVNATDSEIMGFRFRPANGQAQPSFWLDDALLVRDEPADVPRITVDASRSLRTFDTRTFGTVAGASDETLLQPSTAEMLKAAGVRFLRWPGGSVADSFHWKTNTHHWTGERFPVTTDDFLRVASRVSAEALITVNYCTGTAAEAAEWVRHVNRVGGHGVRHWELGNEVYGGWQADLHNPSHDAYTYANEYVNFRQRMRAEDPSILLGVILHNDAAFPQRTRVRNPRTGEMSDGWSPVVIATLAARGVAPDYVSLHYYTNAPGKEDDAFLLNEGARGWRDIQRSVRQMMLDYGGPAWATVPILVSEAGSAWSNPGKQTTNLVSALYLADSIGTVSQTELNSFVWWNVHNEYSARNNNHPSLFGWRNWGDYGLLADGEGPLPLNRPHAPYFGLRMWSLTAAKGDLVLPVTSTHPLLTVYAYRRNNRLALMVINKHSTRDIDADVQMLGYTPPPLGVAYRYGKGEDQQGEDISATPLANLPATFRYRFPSYSITTLIMGDAGIQPAQLPAAPKKVSAKSAGKAVRVSWQTVSGAQWYTVYRAVGKKGTYVRYGEAAATQTTFTDASVQSGMAYGYQVSASNVAGEGAHSRSTSRIKVK